jgi:RNA polymerase sigma factor (sigma-70 family)
VTPKTAHEQFEATVLPYLDDALNLARWLTRNRQDAEDVVQESYLRALRAFDSFRPGCDGRAWLLKIVRNTCFTWLRQNRPGYATAAFDGNSPHAAGGAYPSPEALLMEKIDSKMLHEAIDDVPFEYREVLILRELEGMSYKEIAEIVGVPLGTVMSRLSRGRRELERRLERSRPPATMPSMAKRWAAGATIVALLGVTTALVVTLLKRPSQQELLAQEAVASHIRSLMADHLTDVASSDQHTVKPWFNGKLDFAPVVRDLIAQGFPLTGGRLDYLNNRRVAALSYKRHQHTINLFQWPSSGSDSAPKALSVRGYNVLHWTKAGITYWAVSDLNAAELTDFARKQSQ